MNYTAADIGRQLRGGVAATGVVNTGRYRATVTGARTSATRTPSTPGTTKVRSSSVAMQVVSAAKSGPRLNGQPA